MSFVPKISILFESAHMQSIVGYKELKNGHIEFDAVLQTVDEINRNTNFYPRDVLAEALAAPRIADLVRRHAWFGEGSHPYERKDFARSVDILPAKVTHRICQVPYLKGNDVVSKIHTVEPCGKQIVSWVVDEGTQMGFSMRGLTPYSFTKTKPFAHKVIKAPMNIITYDAVFYPSHPGALMMDGAGGEYTPAQESVVPTAEFAKYFTEESAVYKIFHDELGITLNCEAGIARAGKDCVDVTLEDGRLARLNVEEKLLRDVAQYL